MNKPVLFILILILSTPIFSQVVINELSNMNRNTIYNDEEDAEDWIELYNKSNEEISLMDWTLTDNPDNFDKWVFPDISIKPGGYVILFASGKVPENELVHHWESMVYSYDQWKYFPGNTQPPSNWFDPGFNDGTWQSAKGGFGYGNDTCINTLISQGTNSVYSRIHFEVEDLKNVMRAVLHMDFSDGFIAYLNGSEIARKNLPGNNPPFYEYASSANDPVLHKGEKPQAWYLDQNLLMGLLKKGRNVLAIQVHQSKYNTEGLSSNAFFTLGFRKENNSNRPVPEWMNLGETFFDLNFKITEGEELVLRDPSGTLMDSYIVPELHTDHSAGRSPDGGTDLCIFEKATPGAPNTSHCYEGYEPAPVFSQKGGFFTGNQTIKIEPAVEGSVIRYTREGNKPTTKSLQLNELLEISETQVLAARSFSKHNRLPSRVVKETFFIDENSSLPVFSISADSSDLWDHHTGILAFGPNASSEKPFYGANFWQRWEREADIEYFDKEKNKQFSITAGLRVHGGHSRAWDQKSMRIHCRASYGANFINYPLIPDKEHISSYKRVVLRNGGSDFLNTRFRDAFIQRLMRTSNLDYLGYEPAIAFLNGQYWGLYGIRERVDKHYLRSNHNFAYNSEFDILEYHGRLKIQDGSDREFYNMYDYVMSRDASEQQYYKNVNNLFDLENFADFFIVQTFTYNYDWLLENFTSNMKFWRPRTPDGRWRFFLVDLDFGLGLKRATEPDHNTIDLARNPTDPNPLTDLFDKMLMNKEFRHYFINRYADLMNTCLHINHIKSTLDEFVQNIETEMPRQTERWDYPIDYWYSSLNRLKWYAENRIDYARQHVQDEFDLNRQVDVTLDVYPEGAGKIKISTIIPDSLPWTGVYFDGVPVTITAIADSGYTFKHWGSNTLMFQEEKSASITINISLDETFTAYFEESPEEDEDEIKEEKIFALQAFPNPANEQMRIRIQSEREDPDMTLEIFDFVGKKMKSIPVLNEQSIVLNRQEFGNGIYFLKLSDNMAFIVEKVIFN